MREFLDLTDGVWEWRWRVERDGAAGAWRPASLRLEGRRAAWRLAFPVGRPDTAGASAWRLEPVDSLRWHSVVRRLAPQRDPVPLPLPRLRLASAYYYDLCGLLQDLMAPRFECRVPHWPSLPVPVRCADAVSGEIDLCACLREAVDNWNRAAAPDSLFRWDPAAGWGVRLIHYPGTIRSPSLSARVIRQEDRWHPLRVHILTGDNFTAARVRRYVVRGLAHELGHGLLLWGHSRDRRHVLWGSAPPMVDTPSPDEVTAALLLERLPSGLDLGVYGRSGELDP